MASSVLAAVLSASMCAALINLAEHLPAAVDMVNSADELDGARPGPPDDAVPRIAVVLDDCGGNLELARRVLSTDIPLTWAIIPDLKYSVETAEMLGEAGVPFLVHVPMQAVIDPPGKAARRGLYRIAAGMSERAVREALIPMLDGLNGAIGINNHRGSAATADRGVMDAVMEVLAERDLFFLDSRTSAESVAYDSAVKHGLRAAYNSRFLDNESDRDKIAGQMRGALKSAGRRGAIAAICHLRPETVSFLENFSGELSNGIHESGVKFITLAEWPDRAKGEGI